MLEAEFAPVNVNFVVDKDGLSAYPSSDFSLENAVTGGGLSLSWNEKDHPHEAHSSYGPVDVVESGDHIILSVGGGAYLISGGSVAIEIDITEFSEWMGW
jgi:hypothetical protein